MPALSASVLRGIFCRFVLLLDVEVRFDCACSHKVRCRLLSASVLRGMCRRFVLLLDVEVRFDCAGSHKVRCRLLSASVLRGMYRRFVLLLDDDLRFDCAGSHKVRCRLLSASVLRGIYRRFLLLLGVSIASRKLDFFAFLAAPGTVGVLSRGPAARVSGERGSIPALSARACFPFFGHAWMVLLCRDGFSMVTTTKQQQQQRHIRGRSLQQEELRALAKDKLLAVLPAVSFQALLDYAVPGEMGRELEEYGEVLVAAQEAARVTELLRALGAGADELRKVSSV